MDGKHGTLSSTRSDKLLVLLKREVWNLDIYTVTDVRHLKTISFPGQIKETNACDRVFERKFYSFVETIERKNGGV